MPSGMSDLAIVGQAVPVLEASLTHINDFPVHGQGTYTVYVGNHLFAMATAGTITVTENLPAGLSLVGMSGGRLEL